VQRKPVVSVAADDTSGLRGIFHPLQLAILGPWIPSTQYWGEIMNWDQVEGNWKQIKGKIKQEWGNLTDDQLDVIAGKRDQLVGKLQESYGISKADAEKRVTEWEATHRA